MGTIDEHWCSNCKRKLDKVKDSYLDLESIRLKFPGKKGILCSECLEKPEYEALRNLLGAGNPVFLPFVECHLHAVCSTFKPVSTKPVRCGHIAVVGDTIYCKRRHPGSVKLVVERSERIKLEQHLLFRAFKQLARALPQDLQETFKTLLNFGLKGRYIPPSGIIPKVTPSLEMQQIKGTSEERR